MRLLLSLAVAVLGMFCAHAPPAEASLASIGYTVLRWLDRADILHHDLVARIDPPGWTSTFTDDVAFRSRGSRTLHVLLGKDARLDRITIPGTGESVTFTRSVAIGALPFDIYRIELPRQPAEETFTLRFEWTIDASTLRLISPFIARDFYYIGFASLWYPHMPEESFFTADVTILTPPEYQAFAEGAAVIPSGGDSPGTAVDGAGATWTGASGGGGRPGAGGDAGAAAHSDPGGGTGMVEGWVAHRYRTTVPVNGMGIGVGRFRNDYLIEIDSYRVEVWRPVGYPSTAAQAGLSASRALRFLADRLGPPPAGEFRVVEAPFAAATSYTSLSNLVYGGDLSALGLGGREGLALFVAHETVHKWMGSAVGVRLIGGAWLSEGLADYLGYLALAAAEGSTAAQRVFASRTYEPFTTTRQGRALGSIELFDQDAPWLYAKGPLVFRMLHRRLGTERFFAVLRSFIEEYRGMHVTGRDFEAWVVRQTAGAAGAGRQASPPGAPAAPASGLPRDWGEPLYPDGAGGDLNAFFNTWIRSNRMLDYELGVEVGRVRPGEPVSVTVAVRSAGQVVEPGAVDVALYFPDGTVEWVALAPGERRTFQFASAPEEARLDPAFWLADARPANNVWRSGD